MSACPIPDMCLVLWVVRGFLGEEPPSTRVHGALGNTLSNPEEAGRAGMKSREVRGGKILDEHIVRKFCSRGMHFLMPNCML